MLRLHLGIKECSYYFDGLLKNSERLDSDLLEGLVTHHSERSSCHSVRATAAQSANEFSPGAIERVMDYSEEAV